MHTQMLREMEDVTAGPLLIFSDKSWQFEELPKDWQSKCHYTYLHKGKEGGHKQLQASPGLLAK